MRAKGIFVTLFVTANLAGAAFALAQGNGNGKGNGGGGGGDGGGDPPADFEPAIAYTVETNKYKDIRISNVAGDQSCLVMRISNDDPDGALLSYAMSGATKRFVFSTHNDTSDNLYVTTWDTTPCEVDPNPQIIFTRADFPTYDGNNRMDRLDFSPDGNQIVFSLNPEVEDGSRDLVFYDFSAGHNRVSTDYFVLTARFSPDYHNSGEVFFTGRDLVTPGVSYALFGYQNGSVRPIAPGPNFDSSLGVSNPDEQLGVRIAVRDNEGGLIHQFDENGNERENPIDGYSAELAYSCDNSQIVYRYAVNWRNYDTYFGAQDGTSNQIWSSSDLREFSWICP